MRRPEFNLLFVFGPMLLWLLMLILFAPMIALSGSFICYVAGMVLLAYAKSEMFLRGTWFSFGPSNLTRNGRAAYRQAYELIGAGTALNLIAQLMFFVLRHGAPHAV
ncbi:MAG: hypothetical protein KDB03_07205 [Planctomycetales bacterium]|nr:hypothetical protein [Planctomycetales bacterium]